MKVIIAGSRSITDYRVLLEAIKLWPQDKPITEVVSGAAKGVDRLGEKWAGEQGIKVQRFFADWATHGKSAGNLRNIQMAYYADGLLAVWDGVSRGTAHMIRYATKQGLPVFVYQVELP